MWGGAQTAPARRLFLSSPDVTLPPPPSRHPRSRLSLKATCASTSTRARLAGAGSSMRRETQPRLAAVQGPPALSLAASAARRDATTGLAFLLFVLALVMSSFLSVAIFSFPAWRALKQLERIAHKLSKVVAEEVPGTLSSLKLSIMEISDITSQLKNLRQSFTINRSER